MTVLLGEAIEIGLRFPEEPEREKMNRMFYFVQPNLLRLQFIMLNSQSKPPMSDKNIVA